MSFHDDIPPEFQAGRRDGGTEPATIAWYFGAMAINCAAFGLIAWAWDKFSPTYREYDKKTRIEFTQRVISIINVYLIVIFGLMTYIDEAYLSVRFGLSPWNRIWTIIALGFWGFDLFVIFFGLRRLRKKFQLILHHVVILIGALWIYDTQIFIWGAGTMSVTIFNDVFSDTKWLALRLKMMEKNGLVHQFMDFFEYTTFCGIRFWWILYLVISTAVWGEWTSFPWNVDNLMYCAGTVLICLFIALNWHWVIQLSIHSYRKGRKWVFFGPVVRPPYVPRAQRRQAEQQAVTPDPCTQNLPSSLTGQGTPNSVALAVSTTPPARPVSVTDTPSNPISTTPSPVHSS